MNNNICQFFIIFGNNNFTVPNTNDVYINATSIKDLKELSNVILDNYRKKAKLGFKVGNEIIFLIPDERYRKNTLEVIKQLKVNGKIKVLEQPNQIKQPQQKVVLENTNINQPTTTIVAPNTINNNVVSSTINTNNNQNVKKEEVVQNNNVNNETENKKTSPQLNNIYRGTVDSNTYANFNKKKKNKENKVAIIIFIISLIFFIISLILLFVM